MVAASGAWRFGRNTPERVGLVLEAVGGWVIEDAPGGLAEVREALDAAVRPVLERLRPVQDAATWLIGEGAGLDRPVAAPIAVLRVRRRDGSLAGSALITHPAFSLDALSSPTLLAR